jgi:predicted N-acetyltransferase YhbS
MSSTKMSLQIKLDYVAAKLSRSEKPNKKFKVVVEDRTIHFGSKGMSDYTINQDPNRKRLYIKRHKVRENWSKSGIGTAGFWSRWLLWNKPSLNESIQDIKKRFHINIK